MSVFRFEASPTTSKPISKRTKAKCKDIGGPTFAFSTNPSLLQDITLDKTESGMRNAASSGLTMKEYEKQLQKLTAENFNLKLRVYFAEERLSKVIGINDKEDLIQKNIQLKDNCETQLKELEKKQELLFEASNAFELLQKEHAEEMDRLIKEKNKEISEWEEKFSKLEATYQEIRAKFPHLENLNDPEAGIKAIEDYEKQIATLESNLRHEEDRHKELENMLSDNQLELESYELKSQRLESELNQRLHRVEELVDELEQKEHELVAANLRVKKLEDEVKSKQREEEIMKERIEERNKTIKTLKSSLEVLENKITKERSSMQSKVDGLTFQNARLKEELEILQSRLRRTAEALSPRGKGRSTEDEQLKQKYEELCRIAEEKDAQYNKRLKEVEEKLREQQSEVEEYRELMDKHKKLEDDHRKACTALKNFIKRSTNEKKEREVLNHMIKDQEGYIADLKSQLERYRNHSLPRLSQDDKLSLAETGDNSRDLECSVPKKENSHLENGRGLPMASTEDEMKRKTAGDVNERLDRMAELEAEVIVINDQLKDDFVLDADNKDSSKQHLMRELETKKCEIEKLNGEIKKRNAYLQEMTGIEFEEKNRQIEKLEKQLSEMNELTSAEIMMLHHELNLKDHQLCILQNKLQELGAAPDWSALLECKLFLGVAKSESLNSGLGDHVNEVSVWSLDNVDEPCRSSHKAGQGNENAAGDGRIVGQHPADRTRSREPGHDLQNDAVKVCSLLSMRLEELAEFLDSLLKNGDLMSCVDMKKCADIKQVMEKSIDLSRHLSQSFARRNLSDTSLKWNGCETSLSESLTKNDSLLSCVTKDKVISEQTMIINKLREQLKILNQQIKQRDIELSHCQGTGEKAFDDDDDDDNLDFSEQEGIEKQTLSICQELSDDFDEDNEFPKEWTEERCDKPETSDKRICFFAKGRNPCKENNETSESEAWSEPDRSVSLARMGKLEDVGLTLSQRNSRCDYSSDSSEGTLNEHLRVSGLRCRSAESEIRKLQTRIKTLDEVNDHLRLQIGLLNSGKVIKTESSSMLEKGEEGNLAEKLKKTMDRLDECSLTCRQMEEKLASALERASASAVQLSKATETISVLEHQISQLKEEVEVKNCESEEKSRLIAKLESKISEISKESELKLLEAVRQRESAERKTFEVECRLKDAENMSKEVESKVNEIEKKICETKKLKKETTLHFKEVEKHVDTAEKMMEEAEKIKLEAERKSKDFQNFIDLMRKEVEEKMKEAEKRIKKSEKEKDEMEKQVLKLKKKLLEAEKNKTEVETKVKEGKETIQCMEEKLKELEVAMDQCNEDAQRKIKEIQKKADAKVMELEMKIDEREWLRKSELEKKIVEAEKISKELETGFRKQLEEAEKRVAKAKEAAENVIKKVQEDSKKQEAVFRQRMAETEEEKKKEIADLLRQLDEAKLEASEFELELTKVTNEKIHLEEELKRMLDKEFALVKDNKEIRGKYENSIHELENKLTQLTLNKSYLASRLEDIESTNIDLVSRISAIRGKETVILEREFTSSASPTFSPPRHGSPLSNFLTDVDFSGPLELDESKHYIRHGSAASDPGNHSMEAFAPPRRNMNSSPDLGIESDPGRFSSLEAHHVTTASRVPVFENCEPVEIKKLEYENAELRRRLIRTRQALEETLTQLSAANQRKKQVERAICKQLHKTHHILKKARVNFEAQDGDSLD